MTILCDSKPTNKRFSRETDKQTDRQPAIGENGPPDTYRNYQPGRRMMMGIRMLKNSCVTGENDSQQRYNVAMLKLLQGNYHAFLSTSSNNL